MPRDDQMEQWLKAAGASMRSASAQMDAKLMTRLEADARIQMRLARRTLWHDLMAQMREEIGGWRAIAAYSACLACGIFLSDILSNSFENSADQATLAPESYTGIDAPTMASPFSLYALDQILEDAS